MSLYRRRGIISGSDVNNAKNTLIAQPRYSASFHSTSSISGNDNLVYFDYDMQDEIHLCKTVQEIEDVSSYYKDHSWVIPPPPPNSDYRGMKLTDIINANT